MNFQKLKSYKLTHNMYASLTSDGIAYNNDDLILKITAMWSNKIILVVHKSNEYDIELCYGVISK